VSAARLQACDAVRRNEQQPTADRGAQADDRRQRVRKVESRYQVIHAAEPFASRVEQRAPR
jgi:hypothetical protein